MKVDLRYNLQHIGDIFVGAVQKTADSALLCSKSVFLTYDIKLIQAKKQQVSRDIGERVTLLMREGVSDIGNDSTLTALIGKLNGIEKDLAKHEYERSHLVNPFKTKTTAFERPTNSAEKE